MSMFQSAQDLIDQISNKERVREWLRTSSTTTTPTPAPPVVFEDKADLSVHNDITNESHYVMLDHSNNGFSFVNVHWASF